MPETRVLLFPRASNPGTLQLWICVYPIAAVPTLSWTLDGTPQVPEALRPIQSARPPDQVVDTQSLRAFTGIYEFGGVAAGRTCSVSISVRPKGATTTKGATIQVQTLPQSVTVAPPDAGPLDGWFNVLLVSCFRKGRSDDPSWGHTLRHEILDRLGFRPALTLFMGDQVYLDLPPLKDLPGETASLAELFEAAYLENWTDELGLRQLLEIAPAIFIPDDHEFWNNAPHPSPWIGNSFTAKGRAAWKAASLSLVRAFQATVGSTVRPQTTGTETEGRATRLDIPPLSFLVADGRSCRDEEKRWTIPTGIDGLPPTAAEIASWASSLSNGSIGLFATGQSLLRKKGGALSDFEHPDYADYPTLLLALAAGARERAPLFLLTGDVHWGRVTVSTNSTGVQMLEVISSPLALVETPVADQLEDAGNFISTLFGHKNPWPHHGHAEMPPDFGKGILASEFVSQCAHAQRGNCVCLLSFRRRGEGAGGVLEARLTYASLHREQSVRGSERADLGPFRVDARIPADIGGRSC